MLQQKLNEDRSEQAVSKVVPTCLDKAYRKLPSSKRNPKQRQHHYHHSHEKDGAFKTKEEFKSIVEVDSQKLNEKYQKLKENECKEVKTPQDESDVKIKLSNQLELLVFKIINESDSLKQETISNQLNHLLHSNPELTQHGLMTLLEQSNSSSDKANYILSQSPNLLHEYCILKKGMIEEEMKRLSAMEDVEQDGLLKISNLYQIEAKLNCNAHIYLTSSIKEKVSEQYLGKLIALLTRPIHFLKADSHDESGIKTYLGITKIKIVGEDLEIILELHKDQFGNLLFVTQDVVVDHKDLERDSSQYARCMIAHPKLSMKEIIESLS